MMPCNARSGPLRILLVEDNEDEAIFVREALSEQLALVEVNLAGDGADAIDLLREQVKTDAQPDLVLLDLDLPNVSGHDVLEKVKSDPVLCEIPIVILTTSRARDDVRRAYRAHANAFISKPRRFADYEEVVARIQAFWLDLATLPSKHGSDEEPASAA